MTERLKTREDLISEGWKPCDYCGRPIKPGYEEIHAETCRRRQEALRELVGKGGERGPDE
jgi:hypothetical protein